MSEDRNIVVTTANMERGVPEEPPMPSFDLTIADYRCKGIDPIIAQASKKFIDDEYFVRSRALAQLLCRKNLGNLEERYKKIKA